MYELSSVRLVVRKITGISALVMIMTPLDEPDVEVVMLLLPWWSWLWWWWKKKYVVPAVVILRKNQGQCSRVLVEIKWI
jgi:hypothetical protein